MTVNDNICEIESESITSSDIRNGNERCAPTKSFEGGSCIPLHILIEMAHAYNKDNPNNIIKLSTTHETLCPNKYKRYLVKQFKHKLKGTCNNQQCWTKQAFMKHLEEKMKDELETDTFRPKGPKGQFTWLNTSDIDKVMEQYEEKYKDFKFLGAVPIDFDSLEQHKVSKEKIKELYDNNKTKLGIIFNLDEHDQPGSHWVAMYADLKKGTVYFSDSYGIAPEARIKALMRRIANFIKANGGSPVVDYSRMQHQKQNSECGVFSVAFLLRLLKGDTFEKLVSKRVPDEEINKCRQYYFT